MIKAHLVAFATIAAALAPHVASAEGHDSGVSVTPLGSHDGEFCRLDRAMVLEDPDGTRILYDAGRTVAGADDPRLGDIDVVLLSHVHGDHLGDRRIKAVNAGSCGSPEFPVATTPNSNTAEIAAAKGATIVVGSEMTGFLSKKVEALGGDPETVKLARFGGKQSVGGVTITTVPAVHSNGLGGDFIEGELGEMLSASGLNAYVGPPTGYVLTFSNGLSVYLSGDTGVTAEQGTVVRDQFGAKLAVMNIGDTFTTGPEEAAFVMNDLVEPTSVIASHANEAATEGGEVLDGTKTQAFIEATDAPVLVPLSGRTMIFDADGACIEGCE